MAQYVSKNTRLGQTRAGWHARLEDRLFPGRFAKGQFWRPRHSVSLIRMGPELAATDLWTHSIRARMKAERKVPEELPFSRGWDRDLSGKWVQRGTLHRQPKREDRKPGGPSRTGSERWPSSKHSMRTNQRRELRQRK